MKIRPGRTQSLIGSIAMLLVMVVGAVLMTSIAGVPPLFLALWIIFGLGAAAVAFYNAFSEKGVPLYEIEARDDTADAFCPNCGRSVGRDDSFCRNCGHRLKP
jgi:hypothetical protein